MAKAKSTASMAISMAKRRKALLEGYTPYIPNIYNSRGIGKRISIVSGGKNIGISKMIADDMGLTPDSYVVIYSKDDKIIIMSAQPHEENVKQVKTMGTGTTLYVYCRDLLLRKGITASQSCSYEYLEDEEMLVVNL